MTIKDMDIFNNVVRCSNLTEVSKEMGLTQPNISMTIKSIEKEFREPLFDRIGRKLVLNERGRLLHQNISPILFQLKDVSNNFSRNKISGQINIAATNTIGVYVLPIMLYQYNNFYKDVKLNHFYHDVSDVVELICNGKLDIAFIESEPNNKNIIKEFLYKDELVVVSSDESLTHKSHYIDELFNKEWILREKTSGIIKVFYDYLGDLHESLNVVLELEHTLALKQILQTYPGTISILPLKSIEYELNHKMLYKLDIINMKFERNCYLVYHKNKFQNAVFKSFRDYIISNISNYCETPFYDQ